jgi:hypothetical protein
MWFAIIGHLTGKSIKSSIKPSWESIKCSWEICLKYCSDRY